MAKAKTRLLASVITVLVIAYATWCARCFYLTPKLAFPSDMPGEYQQMTQDWHAANDLPKPAPWSWGRLSAEMRYPFRTPVVPTLRVASFSDEVTLTFVCSHDDLVYGIEGKVDGPGVHERIIRGAPSSPDHEIEVIRHP